MYNAVNSEISDKSYGFFFIFQHDEPCIPGPALLVSITDLISLPMIPTLRPSPVHTTFDASLAATTFTLKGEPRT